MMPSSRCCANTVTGPVTTVGLDPSCDLWAEAITLDAAGCAAFTLRRDDETIPVQLGTPGGHQVRNALTAAAAAFAADATSAAVQAGLAAYRPSPGRMQTLRAPRGFTVVDDTYNANPTAMRAVLDFLAAVPGGKKVAILGDMRELGPTAAALHARDRLLMRCRWASMPSSRWENWDANTPLSPTHALAGSPTTTPPSPPRWIFWPPTMWCW